MNKDQILNKLQEQLNAVAHFYNSDRILGIFLYGSQNYNTATENSDIDSKVIYLPTFEEFCLNQEWISKEIQLKNNEHAEVKDIRLTRQMLMKQNINFIEILYTDYFILNPKYEELFNQYFINNRDDISYMNRGKALSSIASQVYHTLEQDPYNDKKLYNAQRLYYFLEDYFAGVPYKKCLSAEGARLIELMRLKEGTFFAYNDLKGKRALVQNIRSNIQLLYERYKGCESPSYEAGLAAINKGTIKILEASFDTREPEPALTAEDFKKQLTNAEHRAYLSIVSEIGTEGSISIAQLVNKNNISRPVYNNLFNKLKEFKVATISNKGVKGTYIKIIHPELKVKGIDF